MSPNTPLQRQKPAFYYECSRCGKRPPSLKAGYTHLEKKHNSYGILTWHDYRTPK